jgi:hypothetical protein
VKAAGGEQLVHHRRQPAGAVVFLAEIPAGRLYIDEQRHVVADRLPILDRKRDADVSNEGVGFRDQRLRQHAAGALSGKLGQRIVDGVRLTDSSA